MTDEKAGRYAASLEALATVEQMIPAGTQTFSKSPLHLPRGRAPHFLEDGQGGRVRDIDGNEYVDLMAALLAVMLGYCDPDVDAAIRGQLACGISFSLATRLEGALAERLVDVVPSAEMVRFFKNGSDATAAAVRVARAATGRDRVIAIGYHGWQDWYIGATTRHKGVPAAVAALTDRVPYNDLAGLEATFQAHPDEIAAVIMEPVHGEEPKPNYLESVRELVHGAGAVLVFDEIITGCRIALGGAQQHYGVTPDLTCLGKALGNGMPLSALAGHRELMREFDDIFVSGTFGGESLSLAAGIAVLDKIAQEPVISTLWETGRSMTVAVRDAIVAHGLADVIQVGGPAPMQGIAFQDHAHGSAAAIRTLWVTEMLARGVLTTGALNVIYAHDEADLARFAAAVDAACERLARELERPGLDRRLDCPLIRPVFSVRDQ